MKPGPVFSGRIKNLQNEKDHKQLPAVTICGLELLSEQTGDRVIDKPVYPDLNAD